MFLLIAFVRADEYDTLRLKWFDSIVGTGYNTADPIVISRLNSIASEANTHSASMDKSSTRTYLWSDLASTTVSADINNSYNRLRAMALAYATQGCSLAGNSTLLADILSGLDWMYTNRYSPTKSIYSNWWDWEIGAPYRLMDIVVLLYDQLSPNQIANYTNAVEKFTPSATTQAPGGTSGSFIGANRMWKIRVVAVRGAVVKDSVKLAAARDAFSDLFVYVTSGDGFHADGSFIQHIDHPYTAGYGASLLVHMIPVFSMLSGSTWAVTDPAQSHMFNWIYDSFEPIIYRGAAWDLVRGRGVSQPNASPQTNGHDIINSILQMPQFAPPADAARLKSMVKEWALSDTARSFVAQRPLPTLAQAQELVADPSVVRRGELIGHYAFPGMDRVVHLGKGYGFGLSMCSTRIANFESINGNNLRGWFSGDGMTMLYNADLNVFADAYAPTVDPYRMPGVTADATHNKLPSTSSTLGPRAQGQNTNSPHNWVGGAKLDNYGAAGMQFKGVGVTLTGKKSWFMFDDEVVCLGAGITSTDNRPIETTVENRKLDSTGSNAFTVNGIAKSSTLGWTETMSGVTWAHLAGTASAANIGYYFPQAATINAIREARTGAWSDVDSGSSSPITRNYLRVGFQHGNNPTNATYQYVLLPGGSASRVARYAAQPQVSVITNNANVQAVSESALGITAANFWTDTTLTAGGITVDKKCSVLVRNDGTFIDVAVSDPTQANTGNITVQLASSATAVASADSGVTVTQINSNIAFTVNVNNARGRTFKARFYIGTVQTVDVAPEADTYVYDGTGFLDTNYGTETRVIVKKANEGFNRESYLRFDVPTWDGALLGASLKLMPINVAVPGVNAVSVVSDNSWIESGAGSLTWNNRPASSATLLSDWIPTLDVPVNANVSDAITGSGPVSFHLRAITETSNGIVYYGSRESTTVANRPQLSLFIGHTPPEIHITSPGDGDVIINGANLTITADAQPTDGAVTGVSFYDGATLLGTDTTAPYSITTTLAGGYHNLTAVATDSNALTKTSLAHDIEVAYPPTAAAETVDTIRNMAVDVDLRPLVVDGDTPITRLRFTLGAAVNGSVVLLVDGHTARFTPAADYSGPANFAYTVTDTTTDSRTLLNYDFQASDATDVSGRGRDGIINVQGTGTATFTADFPAAFAPDHTQSIFLTENGSAGAARVERVFAAEDLNLVGDDWTVTGWFKRDTLSNMDVVMQIGDSGGFNPHAITLGYYNTSDTLELRNYNVSTLDISMSKANVAAGTWHHYAVVRDGAILKLYLDGTLVGSDSSFGFSFTPATAIKFGAPSNTVVVERWFNGSLADLAVFKGALGVDEITKLATLPAAYLAGQSATNTVTVNVAYPPTAIAGTASIPRDVPVDVDLRLLASDVETPAAGLHFTLGAVTNGSVILLSDGHTARFIPAADFTGPASFTYTVTDITRDSRTLCNYKFQSSDVTDASGNGRDGTLSVQGTGTATFPIDSPAALGPHFMQSLLLTENGTAGAARLQRVMATTDLNVVTDDWTITGWFKRSTATNMDVIMQIGDSAGFGANALTLAYFNNSNTLQLRNYDGSNVQDFDVTKTNVAANTWHHYAVVRDGSTLSLYLNGSFQGSGNAFTFSFSSATAIKFGGPSNTAVLDRWFNGSLADLAVFKGVLDAVEITKLCTRPTTYSGGQSATSSVAVTVMSALDSWRLDQFGTTDNTGNTANDADWDGDGNSNFMEFAIGTNPKSPTTSQVSATKAGSVIEFIYQRSHESMGEVSHIVEWSDNLAPPWSILGVTEEILFDNGTLQTIKAEVPEGNSGRRFVRLRMVR
jgi:hyaluronate lyase